MYPLPQHISQLKLLFFLEKIDFATQSRQHLLLPLCFKKENKNNNSQQKVCRKSVWSQESFLKKQFTTSESGGSAHSNTFH